LQAHSSRAEFSIHEKTGDVLVRILDISTNEVIREIPPRKIKDMVANFLERAGLLVDKRA
ncbi:MAG: flagellar protein FlaG, partial [Clostridiales bacterium]|nr:flagellar protein FlaG [Clostridiales bacterium]